MNLRPNRRRPPEIALIPLLDVLLVLLIFFMVSTTFRDPDEARLRIQLPQAQGETPPDQEPEQIRIVIDSAGRFYVNDRAVTDTRPTTLVQALNGALSKHADTAARSLPVLLQADAQTPHQAVMTALDAAAEVGLVRVAFSATRADTGAAGSPAGRPPAPSKPATGATP